MTPSNKAARTAGQAGIAAAIVVLLSSRWLHLDVHESEALTVILATVFSLAQNEWEQRRRAGKIVRRSVRERLIRVPLGYSGKHTER